MSDTGQTRKKKSEKLKKGDYTMILQKIATPSLLLSTLISTAVALSSSSNKQHKQKGFFKK